jgi:hypothetical protein
MDAAGWIDPNTHGWIRAPRTDDEWAALALEYGAQHPRPLEEILRHVRASGCRTVVIEHRYVDSDFRSEFSAFWSLRFDSVPAYTRRLHFFTVELSDASSTSCRRTRGISATA